MRLLIFLLLSTPALSASSFKMALRKDAIIPVSATYSLVAPAEKVFLCKSPGASVYHKTKDCRGLGACTHPIIAVTKAEAADKYGRRACKVCY